MQERRTSTLKPSFFRPRLQPTSREDAHPLFWTGYYGDVKTSRLSDQHGCRHSDVDRVELFAKIETSWIGSLESVHTSINAVSHYWQVEVFLLVLLMCLVLLFSPISTQVWRVCLYTVGMCISCSHPNTGVVALLVSELSGFFAEQLQMCCAAVNRFDTNSQTCTILPAILKPQATSPTANILW